MKEGWNVYYYYFLFCLDIYQPRSHLIVNLFCFFIVMIISYLSATLIAVIWHVHLFFFFKSSLEVLEQFHWLYVLNLAIGKWLPNEFESYDSSIEVFSKCRVVQVTTTTIKIYKKHKNIKTKKWYESGNSANSPAIISAHLKCLCWIHKFVKECGECLDISLTTRRPSTYDSLKFLQCSFFYLVLFHPTRITVYGYIATIILRQDIYTATIDIFIFRRKKRKYCTSFAFWLIFHFERWLGRNFQQKKICWTFAKLGRRWVSPTGHSFRGKHPSREEEWSIRS